MLLNRKKFQAGASPIAALSTALFKDINTVLR